MDYTMTIPDGCRGWKEIGCVLIKTRGRWALVACEDGHKRVTLFANLRFRRNKEGF